MRETFSSVIRRAILESGETRYAIAFKCGVDQAVLSRFINGKSGLSLATIDKLVDGLGIEVRLRRKTKDK
jgi:transcriptional regulator with XRE-family HTH domain